MPDNVPQYQSIVKPYFPSIRRRAALARVRASTIVRYFVGSPASLTPNWSSTLQDHPLLLRRTWTIARVG